MLTQIEKYLIDTGLYYDTQHHFWIDYNQGFARIGFSPLLQETSGAFVAIAFEQTGDFVRGQAFGSVEAEKHVAQLMIPLSGKIVATNDDVVANPRLLNSDPYGAGWLVEIECQDFESEVSHLLHGADRVTAWVEAEIKKYEDKGWIARP